MKTSHVRVRIKVWRTTKIIGNARYKSVAIMIEKWVIFKRDYLEISFLRENCGYDGSDERRRNGSLLYGSDTAKQECFMRLQLRLQSLHKHDFISNQLLFYCWLKVLGKSVDLCKTTKRKNQLYISLLVSVWRIICENFNPNGLILSEIWMEI